MIDVDPRHLKDDPSHTLKGFRHQALYILLRVLEEEDDRVFQPEGIEDLAIYGPSGKLQEIVQVKSHTAPLVRSSFRAAFYRRAAARISEHPGVPITIASYGPIGHSFVTALSEADSDERSDLLSHITTIIGDEKTAIQIVDCFRITEITEEEIVDRVVKRLTSLCTSVEPERALEMLWWWAYSACENRTLLDRQQIVKRITDTGRFLRKRTAFHDEWFKTIIPLDHAEVSEQTRETLAEEFASGVAARLEHIIAGVDVRRDAIIDRIRNMFAESNIVVIHGASGQGKTALAYRYCHEFFPAAWRYRINCIDSRSHARNIALALTSHAAVTALHMLVVLDIQPGNTAWIDLVKSLMDQKNIQVLVALREEDWRRAFARLAEFPFRDIELALDKQEAQAIYERVRSIHDVPHVFNFENAWQTFGGQGPLLEFTYFLRHHDTLKGRLKCQVTQIQDSVRRGEIQPQELDFLRLAAVATSHDAMVDLRKLAEKTQVVEPQRTAEVFEKEYFVRLTADKTHIVALHPIRSLVLSQLLTDPAISPWVETARRALDIIRECDIERFLLLAFTREGDNWPGIVGLINSHHPSTWTGLCGCMRALLWFGVRQYVDENETVLRDAFAMYGEGWQVMLDADIAGIADFKPRDALASLGEIGQRATDGANTFVSRQTDTRRVFRHLIPFAESRTRVVLHPATSGDWISLGEVCFWIGHLHIDSPIRNWVSEDLLTRVLAEENLDAMSDACNGVFTMWKDRYQKWYEDHRKEIECKVRTMLRAVSLTAEGDKLSAVFLLSRQELALLADATTLPGSQKTSLNDLVVGKLDILRGIMPFYRAYGCRGIGHRNGLIDPPHDESVKDGVLGKYLLPRWGPLLNNQFLQLSALLFRLPTWAQFSNTTLAVRRGVLDLFLQIQEGILAHFNTKHAVKIIDDHVVPSRWDSLKTKCRHINLLPQCAVDEFGLDAVRSRRGSSAMTTRREGGTSDPVDGYLHAANEYTRTLTNFLMQAPSVLVSTPLVGKAKNRRRYQETKRKLQEAGISTRGCHLTLLNLEDFCGSLVPLQRRIAEILGARTEFREHSSLSQREVKEVPHFWLLWQEFVVRGTCAKDRASRIMNRSRLAVLDAQKLLSQLRERVAQALVRIDREGMKFRILDTDACWEEEPTLWIVCDICDPRRLIDAPQVVQKCLCDVMDTCRNSRSHEFVVGFYWKKIVVVPLVGGKSLRRDAYPHLWNTGLWTQTVESSEWRYLAVPVTEETWQRLSLQSWQLPWLQEFHSFSDAVWKLWELSGHFADLTRVDVDLDDTGSTIVQKYILEEEESLNVMLHDVVNQYVRLCRYVEAIPPVQRSERPLLEECMSLLSELRNRLLPHGESHNRKEVTLSELKGWHCRLTEALGIIRVAEVLWSADALGLECDVGRLFDMLHTRDSFQTGKSGGTS